MCTVTFIPKNNLDFILTSNRDEDPRRASGAPDFYSRHGVTGLYPKDLRSGGTWIGVSERSRLVCVLNGAFEKHERKAEYRKSRGLIALDLLFAEHLDATLKDYDLHDIEPFTAILVDWNILLRCVELVWDGNERYITDLPMESKIWSSSPLYTPKMKSERQEWFDDFKANSKLDAKSVLEFHKTAGAETEDYGVIMDRGFVKTTSITQLEKKGSDVFMHFESLQQDVITEQRLQLS
ncbi:NRDE family protein [Gaetbulibacter aestuarii]|uniref:NRDE family protein n=1 Tax=Gaetbulibacter aestuarii TaxID=1502358 RepID=A0ABW7MY40_9FLAO